MTTGRRWPRAALGAITMVIAVVALGLILEHTVGPAWGGGRTNGPFGAGHTSFDPSAKRIPLAVRQ
jgi:hypothetical protein